MAPREAAQREDPELWDRVKRRVKAGSKGGRRKQWSARKAQLAVREYKAEGGSYKAARKNPSNSLTQWTQQDWGYVEKRDERKPRSQRGRYLPKKVREQLTAAEKRHTDAVKRRASAERRQYASYEGSVKALMRTLRTSSPSSSTPRARQGDRRRRSS